MESVSVAAKIKELWSRINIDEMLAQLGISQSLPVYAALCFGSGFAIGFVFKKYFKFMIGSLIMAAILIKLLEHNQVVAVDMVAFRQFLGLAPDASVSFLVNASFEWIKGNGIIFIATLVGFLFGYKLG